MCLWLAHVTFLTSVYSVRTSWCPKTLCLPDRNTFVVEPEFMCLTYSEAKQTEISGLEQKRVYSKGQARRAGSLCSGRPELPEQSQGRVFRQTCGGEWRAYRVCDFLWIGWWWCKRMVLQKSQASAITFQPYWGLGLVLSLKLSRSYLYQSGAPAPVEELRDKCHVVVHTPGGGTRTLPHSC